MKLITISQGRTVKVDDEDYEFLNQYKWHLTSKGYAARRRHYPSSRKDQKFKIFLMHRVVMFADEPYQVDHWNGDTLDNRKDNLRICTPTQNRGNVNVQSNSTTGYKGVSFEKSIGRYRAYINFQGERHNLKTFKTPEEAAQVYNAKAKELFGEFALLNDIVLTPTTNTTRSLAV
jgi:hypothetical protein